MTGGTHSVFLGVVQRAERFEGPPLAYFKGRFGRLELNSDAPADAEVRRLLGKHFYNAAHSFHR